MYNMDLEKGLCRVKVLTKRIKERVLYDYWYTKETSKSDMDVLRFLFDNATDEGVILFSAGEISSELCIAKSNVERVLGLLIEKELVDQFTHPINNNKTVYKFAIGGY